MPGRPLIALAAALVLAALAGWQGYRLGVDRTEARVAAEAEALRQRLARVAEEASRREAARLALEAERDALARDLEDLARADPDAARPALSADSVRRLARQ